MRLFLSGMLGVIGALMLAVPVYAQDGCQRTAEQIRGGFDAVVCSTEAALHSQGLPDTATETPTTHDQLPIGLAVTVLAGVLAFAYFFMRPSRLTGRKD